MKYQICSITRSISLFSAATMATIMSIANPALAIENRVKRDRITVPSGTIIPVSLNNALSSRNSQRGDKFTATLKSGQDDAGLPRGTRVEGVVQEALPAIDGKPGMLDVDFRKLVFPNGGSMNVQASLYSLNGKDVKRTDGRLTASSDKSQDRLKWVGIGAGAGLLIGAVTKQNELLSGLLGSGAGYLYNELSKKKPGDVTLKEGSSFGVRLDRDISFNDNGTSTSQGAYIVRNDNQNNNDTNRRNGRRTNYGNDNNVNRRGNGNSGNVTGSANNRSNDSRYANIGLSVDGKNTRYDQNSAPYIRNNVVYVPLAATGRTAMFDYQYASRTKTIFVRNEGIRLVLGSRTAYVNGRERTLPAAAMMINDSIYVPMEFIGWAVNGSASYDGDSQMVNITTTRDR